MENRLCNTGPLLCEDHSCHTIKCHFLGVTLIMTHWPLHMQVPLASSLLLASGAATETAASMRVASHPNAPAQAGLARRQPQKCLLTMLMVSTQTLSCI